MTTQATQTQASAIPLEEYEEQVRQRLDEQGLPRNWQPHKTSIEVDHFKGLSVEEAVEYYQRDVERYQILTSGKPHCSS